MERKVLVVGCGGLGCELAKLLAMDPANKLTFVDDDTIDATNLNRQFLFTKNDVGKSKAQVLCEKLKPEKPAEYIFGKIDGFKKLEFYRRFDIVYTCLDNSEARSFVGQRCYAAGIKMVDGGSAGWLGQSFCNEKECFDCLPKRREKIYPICTVRQKPKNFEHCLVWAKTVVEERNRELLDDEMQAQGVTKPANGEFVDGTMSDGKTNYGCIVDISSSEVTALEENQENSPNGVHCENTKRVRANRDGFGFTGILGNLYKRLEDGSEDPIALVYDLAAFKARRFSIQPMPFIDSQTFLKKIIPSICTTNSIIASLMVLSAQQKRNFYLVQGSSGILRTDLNEKNKGCLVCSLPTYLVYYPEKCTISDFLKFFKAESLVSEHNFFDKNSDQGLMDFDGEFLIAIKNGTKNRIYFEKNNVFMSRRIK